MVLDTWLILSTSGEYPGPSSVSTLLLRSLGWKQSLLDDCADKSCIYVSVQPGSTYFTRSRMYIWLILVCSPPATLQQIQCDMHSLSEQRKVIITNIQ